MLFKKYIKRLSVSEPTIVATELADSQAMGVSGSLNMALLKFILIYGNIKTVPEKGCGNNLTW